MSFQVGNMLSAMSFNKKNTIFHACKPIFKELKHIKTTILLYETFEEMYTYKMYVSLLSFGWLENLSIQEQVIELRVDFGIGSEIVFST